MVKNKILKLILSLVLVALTAMHISRILFIGISLNQVSIFIFTAMFYAIWKENRMAYFLSFSLLSFLSILTLSSPAELTPSVLLFIAILYYPSHKALAVSITIIFIGYISSSFLVNYQDTYNIPVGIIGNVGVILSLYFAVIKQPSDIDYLSKTTPLTARQLLILKCLYNGISRREMPDKISDRELWKYDIDNFTFDIINSEISKIKRALELESEFELGAWYEAHIQNNRFTSKI